MNVDGQPFRTIWHQSEEDQVWIIDQTELPHAFITRRLETLETAAHAITAMLVRGAPLIGATAAYGFALGLRTEGDDAAMIHARNTLLATRPTAINLKWSLDRMQSAVANLPPKERFQAALAEAGRICDEDVSVNESIGNHGAALLADLASARSTAPPLNILTHCNAGWLATVDWGTALSPVYKAQAAGIPLHVWVDETRPRNQGASLTAWELGSHGVPHTLITDNAGGHLMQQGKIDLCLVGTDRTTANGDVCNKIGTYLKALAAADNAIPFYVALPSSTIDWSLHDGRSIPIEERDPREVIWIKGQTTGGVMEEVRLAPAGSPALNVAFDVTPARLVTGLITERGICPASTQGLAAMYPEFGSGK